MLLDLYSGSQELTRSASPIAFPPVQGLDAGGLATFDASIRALIAAQDELFAERLRSDFIGEQLDRYFQATGARLEYPWQSPYDDRTTWTDPATLVQPASQVNARVREETRRQFNAWATANGQAPFPTDEEIDAAVLRGRIEEYQAANATLANARSFGSRAAAFAGGMVGTVLSDPMQGGLLALGAPWAAGVVRFALAEAGIGAASAFVGGVLNMGRTREVDPTYGMADVWQQTAYGAAGGLVFGGGIRALAEGWRTLRARGNQPSTVQDAGNVLERESAFSPPAGTPLPLATAVRARIAEVQADMLAGVATPRPDLTQYRTGRVYDAEGREVSVQYQVVEGATLTTSHTADFTANPDFPAEYQPRDRTRAGSQDQIISMAANLQPERLGRAVQAESGAPIVGPDDLVESGNARVLAIMQAYRQGLPGAEAYRAFLRADGFDVDGMAQPVLIARRTSSLSQADRVAFTAAANRSTTLRMGATETALADARLIDPALLGQLADGDVAAAGNRGFVRGFVERLAPGERGEMFDAGRGLSLAGSRRAAAALLARAYGDPALLNRALEDTDSNIKAIAGAMGDVAGAWARLRDAATRGEIPAAMDITGDLLDAVRTVMRARDAGEKVRTLAMQGELYGGPSAVSRAILAAMFADDAMVRPVGRAKLGEFLADYAAEARKNDGAANLLGMAPLSPDEVLATALAKAERQELLETLLAATSREKIDDALTDPVVGMTTVHQLEQMLDADPTRTIDLTIVDDTGAAVVVRRPLREVVAEIDDEIRGAREISACLIPEAA